MKILSRYDLLILFLAILSLFAAWQIDVLLPEQVVVAPLYLIPILIIASRYETPIVIRFTLIAILVLTLEQIYEGQHILTIVFDNVGIAMASYLAIRLNMQRVRAEHLKETSQNAKTQLEIFMHVISHDIKQPITIAKLYTEILTKTTKGPQQSVVRKINTALDSMTMLTVDLSDTAAILGGHLSLHKEPLDISLFLQEIVAEVAVTTTQHTIKTNVPIGLIGQWDRLRLKRVFINLLSNAIKYSPHGGTVTLSAKKQHNNVVIAIQDSGIGLTPQESQALFQPFVRQYKGKRIPGTGLGLYIAKFLITAHKGTIWIKSTKGKGSTFFVSLPLS